MSSEAMNELDALILSNIGDLEAAAHRLFFGIQSHVARQMDSLAKEWVAKNKWKGSFDWDEKGMWVAPPDWQLSEDGWLGKYHLFYGDEDSGGYLAKEDLFWLTRACHKGRGQLGFRWTFDTGLGMKPGQWKAFLKSNQKLTVDLAARGFVPENTGYFFRAFEVDSEKLAASMKSGDIMDALAPMRNALDLLAESKSDFDKILKIARQPSK
jgi:hypothetical protein